MNIILARAIIISAIIISFGIIVRPTKKPTNLSQSGEVPKGGRWMNFWKEVFQWKGGGEGCLGFYRFTFFNFSCFWSRFVYPKRV
jgi:hypothetical protein